MSERITRTEDRFRDHFRFLPVQSQLNEQVWEHGGLFCGRDVQEVYAQDTRELQEAGVTWEKATRFLKCVGIYAKYLDKIARERLYTLYLEHKENLAEYYRKEREYMADIGRLPGFNGTLFFEFTNSREGYYPEVNPVHGEGNMFPAGLTPTERLAYFALEKKLIIPDQMITHVNQLTLYVADSFRMLEKGNQYELTGAQLAGLTASFDEDAFFTRMQPWIDEQLKPSQE